MAAGNDERAIVRRVGREALDRSRLDNRNLAYELVDWVSAGGEKPTGELGPRDAGILFGALTEAIKAALGDSALLGASDYLLRRDEAAPM